MLRFQRPTNCSKAYAVKSGMLEIALITSAYATVLTNAQHKLLCTTMLVMLCWQ